MENRLLKPASISRQEGGGAGVHIKVGSCLSFTAHSPPPQGPHCAPRSCPLEPQALAALPSGSWPSLADWKHQAKTGEKERVWVFDNRPHTPLCYWQRPRSPSGREGSPSPGPQVSRAPVPPSLPLSSQAWAVTAHHSQGTSPPPGGSCHLPRPCHPLLLKLFLQLNLQSVAALSCRYPYPSFLLSARKDVKRYPLFKKKNSMDLTIRKIVRKTPLPMVTSLCTEQNKKQSS